MLSTVSWRNTIPIHREKTLKTEKLMNYSNEMEKNKKKSNLTVYPMTQRIDVVFPQTFIQGADWPAQIIADLYGKKFLHITDPPPPAPSVSAEISSFL